MVKRKAAEGIEASSEEVSAKSAAAKKEPIRRKTATAEKTPTRRKPAAVEKKTARQATAKGTTKVTKDAAKKEKKEPGKIAKKTKIEKEPALPKPAKRSREDKEAAPPKPIKRAKVVTEIEKDVLEAVSHATHGKEPGDIFVVGTGDCGQFGKGEDVMEARRPAPSLVLEKKVLQVAAGGMHSVALTADGCVYTAGVNDEGALGRETGGELWEASPLRTGNVTETETWGKVDVLTTHGAIVQVSAGDSHSVALTEQGFLYAWGTYRDSSGVYGFSAEDRIALLPELVYSPKTAAQQVVKIASGADHAAALTRGGALLTWGTGQQGALGRVGLRLPARGAKELLLQPHPVLFKRGRHKEDIVDFACGTYNTFVLRHEEFLGRNIVYAFGLNNYGQLGVATDKNEVLVPEKLRDSIQEAGVAQVAAGEHHTLVRTTAGKLLSWGRPTYGRLGRADVDVQSDEPVRLEGEVAAQPLEGKEVSSVSAGQTVSAALTAGGEAYVWGNNTTGQLGKGEDEDDSTVPQRLATTKRFPGTPCVQLEFGGQHTLVLVARPAPVGPPAAVPAVAKPRRKPAPEDGGAAAPASVEESADEAGKEAAAAKEGAEEAGKEGATAAPGVAETANGGVADMEVDGKLEPAEEPAAEAATAAPPAPPATARGKKAAPKAKAAAKPRGKAKTGVAKNGAAPATELANGGATDGETVAAPSTNGGGPAEAPAEADAHAPAGDDITGADGNIVAAATNGPSVSTSGPNSLSAAAEDPPAQDGDGDVAMAVVEETVEEVSAVEVVEAVLTEAPGIADDEDLPDAAADVDAPADGQ